MEAAAGMAVGVVLLSHCGPSLASHGISLIAAISLVSETKSPVVPIVLLSTILVVTDRRDYAPE